MIVRQPDYLTEYAWMKEGRKEGMREWVTELVTWVSGYV